MKKDKGTVLITGGLGYLGGRISEFLINSGFNVRIGTRQTNPNIPSSLSSCEVVFFDLLDQVLIESICKNITYVLHLASPNAKECEIDPQSALLTNGLGTLNLLNAADKMGVSKFIYFSTAHVYGAPLMGGIYENSVPKPMHAYSITHRLAEDYVLQADKQKSISGVVLRLTNSVGSPLNRSVNCWMLVVNDLCKQVVVNRGMTLYSGKFVQRDFFPISSIFHIIVSVFDTDKFNGDVFNVSSGTSLTLLELTDLISDRSESTLGFRPDVKFKKLLSREDSEKLFISNNKLRGIGCIVDNSVSNEIDSLLLNCKNWFAK